MLVDRNQPLSTVYCVYYSHEHLQVLACYHRRLQILLQAVLAVMKRAPKEQISCPAVQYSIEMITIFNPGTLFG